MSVLNAVRSLSPRHRRITTLDNLAYFCTVTADSLDRGLGLPRALRVANVHFGDRPFRVKVQPLIARVDNGASLTEAMEVNHETFPPMLRQMVDAGETSEQLSEMLRKAGEFYAAEAAALRDPSSVTCPTCGR